MIKNESDIYYSDAVISGIHFSVHASHKGITHLHINPHKEKINPGAIRLQNDDPYFFNVFDELAEYFETRRKNFDIPLDLKGTEFQVKVWRELKKIPFGHTTSYKVIAEKIGDVKAVRAVGHANSVNPIPVIIPCHRVINNDGSLGGYSCGPEIKERLLELEGCLTADFFH